MLLRFLVSFAFGLALPAMAGPVVLSSPDDAVAIEGELLSRNGEFFRIETEFGPVTIDAGGMKCSGIGCPDPVELITRTTVGGPHDMVERLFPALLEAFSDEHGIYPVRLFADDQNVSWELRELGTERLIAVFDVVMLDRGIASDRLLNGEIQLAFDLVQAPEAVRQDVVALDAIVPAVAPDNPRAMLTLRQLQILLRGETSSWAQFGGSDTQLSIHVSAMEPPWLPRLGIPELAANTTRYDDFDVMADTVAADPAALGLIPYSSLGNAIPLVVSGACGLATPATRDTIRAEDYPITLPVFMQRVGSSHPKLLRDFIAFARGPAAQSTILAAGFIDQAIGRISFERQGNRIANAVLSAGEDADGIAEVQDMIGTLLGGERLTLTYRFEDGSSELDVQSVSNVQRLADAINTGEFAGYDLLFVGFSDGAGDHDGNLRLSDRRARSVRSAVAARVEGVESELRVAAFGELMPMACDDTPWGGHVNRRVEVWIKPSEIARRAE
ncbi:MAG: phosphate ABC transporter substrate-binding/OmpA family protein [Pseudomonadota bacterium]